MATALATAAAFSSSGLQNWLDLSDELLYSILLRLSCIRDLLVFSVICRSWHSFTIAASPTSLFPPFLVCPLSLRRSKNLPLKPTIKPLAMALGSLRRIGAPISLLSKHQIFRPTSSASTAASHSAKASDRIVRLFAIDLDGNKREVVGLTSQTLLRALANAGLIDPASHRLEEIDACLAECEVHIAQERLEKTPVTSPHSSNPIASIPDPSDASRPASPLFLTPPNPTDVPTQQPAPETTSSPKQNPNPNTTKLNLS